MATPACRDARHELDEIALSYLDLMADTAPVALRPAPGSPLTQPAAAGRTANRTEDRHA